MADTPAPRRSGPPSTSRAARLVLVADRDERRGAPADTRVRRYRLARVAPEPRPARSDPLSAVRRTYD